MLVQWSRVVHEESEHFHVKTYASLYCNCICILSEEVYGFAVIRLCLRTESNTGPNALIHNKLIHALRQTCKAYILR